MNPSNRRNSQHDRARLSARSAGGDVDNLHSCRKLLKIYLNNNLNRSTKLSSIDGANKHQNGQIRLNGRIFDYWNRQQKFATACKRCDVIKNNNSTSITIMTTIIMIATILSLVVNGHNIASNNNNNNNNDSDTTSNYEHNKQTTIMIQPTDGQQQLSDYRLYRYSYETSNHNNSLLDKSEHKKLSKLLLLSPPAQSISISSLEKKYPRSTRQRRRATNTGFSGELLPAASSGFEAAFQGECGHDNNNPCEHLCFDLHDGTYECACNPGHTLAIDGYSCTHGTAAGSQQQQQQQQQQQHGISGSYPSMTSEHTSLMAGNAVVKMNAGININKNQSAITSFNIANHNQQQQQQQRQRQENMKMTSKTMKITDNNNNDNVEQGASDHQAQTSSTLEMVTQSYTSSMANMNEDKDIARIKSENDHLLNEFKQLLTTLEKNSSSSDQTLPPRQNDNRRTQPSYQQQSNDDNDKDDTQIRNHLRHYYQLSDYSNPLATTIHSDQQENFNANANADADDISSENAYDDDDDDNGAIRQGDNDDTQQQQQQQPKTPIARRHLESAAAAGSHANDNNDDARGDKYERDLDNLRFISNIHRRDDENLDRRLKQQISNGTSSANEDKLREKEDNDNNLSNNLDNNDEKYEEDQPKEQDKLRVQSSMIESQSLAMLEYNHDVMTAQIDAIQRDNGNNEILYKTCQEMPDCESGGICTLEKEEEEERRKHHQRGARLNPTKRSNTLAIARCRCPLGRGGQLCNKPVQVAVPKFRNQSYLALPMIDDERLNELLIEFKPLAIHESLILYTDLNEHFLALIMDANGQIELRFHNGLDRSQDIISIRSLSQVRLLQWNKLMITSMEIEQLERIRQDFDQLDIVISLASLAKPEDVDEMDKTKMKSPLILNYYPSSSLLATTQENQQANVAYETITTLPKIFKPLNFGRTMDETPYASYDPNHSKASITTTSVTQKPFLRQLFVGGSPNLTSTKTRLSINSGFNGCVRQLQLNKRQYNFRSDNHGDSLDGFDIDECSLVLDP